MNKNIFEYFLKNKVIIFKKMFRRSLNYSMNALSILVTMSTVWSWCVPSEMSINVLFKRFEPIYAFTYLLLGVIAIGLICGIIREWPRLKAVCRSESGMEVSVECCDLLKQDGYRVIHTTDTFDSDSRFYGDPNDVKKRTLCYNFINNCTKIGFDLTGHINSGLKNYIVESFDDSLQGNKKRYPLGTVCKINVSTNSSKVNKHDYFIIGDYLLVAFSHMRQGNVVDLSLEEYKSLLDLIWMNISDSVKKTEKINIALLGQRFIRFPVSYTAEQKIGLMVESFYKTLNKGQFCNSMKICISSEVASSIDFDVMKEIMAFYSRKYFVK